MEIDNSRPFFISLLGSRYGWVPPTYKISEKPEYNWVKSLPPGYSITALETLHGFLNHPFRPVYSFCYVRNPSFIQNITDLSVFN